MPEPTAPHPSTSTTQPQPVLDGSAPPRRPAPAAPPRGGLRTRISGMRVAMIAGIGRMASRGDHRRRHP